MANVKFYTQHKFNLKYSFISYFCSNNKNKELDVLFICLFLIEYNNEKLIYLVVSYFYTRSFGFINKKNKLLDN